MPAAPITATRNLSRRRLLGQHAAAPGDAGQRGDAGRGRRTLEKPAP